MKEIRSKTTAGKSTNDDSFKCQHHPELEDLVIFDRADKSNPKRVVSTSSSKEKKLTPIKCKVVALGTISKNDVQRSQKRCSSTL